MMAFILATDFDFIAYMSKMDFFWEAFFTPITPMAFLENDPVNNECSQYLTAVIMPLPSNS